LKDIVVGGVIFLLWILFASHSGAVVVVVVVDVDDDVFLFFFVVMLLTVQEALIVFEFSGSKETLEAFAVVAEVVAGSFQERRAARAEPVQNFFLEVQF